jgi:hypothetical protein
MKGALIEDEFWYYIEELADYKDKGRPVPKKSRYYGTDFTP